MIIYIFNFLWQNPEKKDGTMLKFYQRGLIWIVASFTIFTLTIMLLDYPLTQILVMDIFFFAGGGGRTRCIIR